MISYQYDSDGIRVISTVNGVKTEFLVDKNRDYAQVLEERNNNSLTASYVYGLDLISQQRGSEKSFYLVDGLGSTRGLTNASGVVTDRYSYDAFGNLIGSGGNTENNYLFAGEQFDKSLGDYYLRQRYYDTDTGRFTRRDSYEGNIFDPVSQHKYLYANANPVNFVDPSGLFSLGEISAVNSILNTLAGLHTNFGFDTNSHLDSRNKAQSFIVDFAIRVYLNTTNAGPNENNNYWKNALIPLTIAYLDFHNFFAFPFRSDVIPIPFPPGTLRTPLPDKTQVIVRPISSRFYPTVEIQRPESLQTRDGRIVNVDRVEKRAGQFKVYNFNVEGFHTYFVSDLGILVHNAEYPSGFSDKPKSLVGVSRGLYLS